MTGYFPKLSAECTNIAIFYSHTKCENSQVKFRMNNSFAGFLALVPPTEYVIETDLNVSPLNTRRISGWSFADTIAWSFIVAINSAMSSYMRHVELNAIAHEKNRTSRMERSR